MIIRTVLLGITGVVFIAMTLLVYMGLQGMLRGIRVFRSLSELKVFKAPDVVLPESDLFKSASEGLEHAGFSYLGSFRVGPTEDHEHTHSEHAYAAPNNRAYASVAAFDDYISVGMFSLFGDEACVETHMNRGPGATETQISKKNYLLKVFNEEINMGTLYKHHKKQVLSLKDDFDQPDTVESMDDVLHQEDIYIHQFTRRRLQYTFRPGALPTAVIAVFHIPFSFLFLQGASAELGVPLIFTLVLPLVTILSLANVVLVGVFSVAARRAG